MAEHGGYRRPSSPAAVSGPGALSRRTDGRPNVADLPDAKYGENAAFQDIQGGAPMGPGPSAPSPGGAPAPTATPPTPLGAPTENPGQPVTAGADAGAGPGFGAMGLPDPGQEAEDLRRRYGPILPLLLRMADAPTSSQQFRDQVRYVVSKIA